MFEERSVMDKNRRKKEYVRSLIRRARGQDSARPLASQTSRLLRFSPTTLYFLLLEKDWWFCGFLTFIVYSVPIAVFGLLSLPLDLVDDVDLPEDSMMDPPSQVEMAFRFTAANIISMGYGTIFPTTNVGYFLATLSQLTGILVNVFVFAVVLAKFQSPKADVIFSKHVCFFTRDSVRYLCIRFGNLRCHTLYNPSLRLFFLRHHETMEGESFVRIRECAVQVPGTVAGVYSITHKIDETSPLKDLNFEKEDFVNEEEAMAPMAFQCIFTALDPVYQADVCAKVSYTKDQLVFGKRFADMMTISDKGEAILDFGSFDELIDCSAPDDFKDRAPDEAHPEKHYSVFEMRNSEAPPREPSQTICLVTGYGRSSYANPKLDGSLPLSVMRSECAFSLSIAIMLAEAGEDYVEYRVDLGDKPDWLGDVNAELQTPACRLAGSEEWLTESALIFARMKEGIPSVSKFFDVTLPHNVHPEQEYYDPSYVCFTLALAYAKKDSQMRSFLFEKLGVLPDLNAQESERILQKKCREMLAKWEGAFGNGVGGQKGKMFEMRNSEAPPREPSQTICLVTGYGRSSYEDEELDGDLPLSVMRSECAFSLSIAVMLAEAGEDYVEYRADLGDKPDWLGDVNAELQTPACRLAGSEEWLNGTDHIFDKIRETMPSVSKFFDVTLPDHINPKKEYYEIPAYVYALALAHAKPELGMRKFLLTKCGVDPKLRGDQCHGLLQRKCSEILGRWEVALGRDEVQQQRRRKSKNKQQRAYLCGDSPGYLDFQLATKLFFAYQMIECGLADLGESFRTLAPLSFAYLQRFQKRASWQKAFGPGYEVATGELHIPMIRVVCNKLAMIAPEITDKVTSPALERTRQTSEAAVQRTYLCGDSPGYLDFQLAPKLFFAYQMIECGLSDLGNSFRSLAPLSFAYLQRFQKRASWQKAFGPGYEVSAGQLHVPMIRVICGKLDVLAPEITDNIIIPALEKARGMKISLLSLSSESQQSAQLQSARLLYRSSSQSSNKSQKITAALCL